MKDAEDLDPDGGVNELHLIYGLHAENNSMKKTILIFKD